MQHGEDEPAARFQQAAQRAGQWAYARHVHDGHGAYGGVVGAFAQRQQRGLVGGVNHAVLHAGRRVRARPGVAYHALRDVRSYDARPVFGQLSRELAVAASHVQQPLAG